MLKSYLVSLLQTYCGFVNLNKRRERDWHFEIHLNKSWKIFLLILSIKSYPLASFTYLWLLPSLCVCDSLAFLKLKTREGERALCLKSHVLGNSWLTDTKTEYTTHMAKLWKSNALGGYKNRTCTTHTAKHWLKGGLCGYNFKLKKKKKTIRFFSFS